MNENMVSKRIQILSLLFSMAFAVWMVMGLLRGTYVEARVAAADAQIAEAEAEIEGAGIQTVVFALG